MLKSSLIGSLLQWLLCIFGNSSRP